MQTLKGQLLIAVPQLSDPNFVRTVVLMIEHDENGAFGVVLNQPTDRTVQEIWNEVDEEPCDCQELINVGGPVSGPLLALHTVDELAEAEVLPGVFLATRREHLDRLVRQTFEPFRLFSGYAGWGGGQLESEMKHGGWLTVEAKHQYIFADPDDLWNCVGKDLTQDVLRSTLNIKDFPDDPSLN